MSTSGGTSGIAAVIAGDASIVVTGGDSVTTGTLDEIAVLHPPVGPVNVAGQEIVACQSAFNGNVGSVATDNDVLLYAIAGIDEGGGQGGAALMGNAGGTAVGTHNLPHTATTPLFATALGLGTYLVFAHAQISATAATKFEIGLAGTGAFTPLEGTVAAEGVTPTGADTAINLSFAGVITVIGAGNFYLAVYNNSATLAGTLQFETSGTGAFTGVSGITFVQIG